MCRGDQNASIRSDSECSVDGDTTLARRPVYTPRALGNLDLYKIRSMQTDSCLRISELLRLELVIILMARNDQG